MLVTLEEAIGGLLGKLTATNRVPEVLEGVKAKFLLAAPLPTGDLLDFP